MYPYAIVWAACELQSPAARILLWLAVPAHLEDFSRLVCVVVMNLCCSKCCRSAAGTQAVVSDFSKQSCQEYSCSCISKVTCWDETAGCEMRVQLVNANSFQSGLY